MTGQHRLLVATGLRLIALLTAAVMGTLTFEVSRVDAAALLAAAGLGVGLVIEVYLLTERPDRQWYESRAAAESAKTLAWRFAVGGQPFGVDDVDDRAAESLLLHRFSVIRGNLGALVIDGDGGGLQVTDEMRELRARDLDGRRRAYRAGRIEDQYRWYAHRSAEHGRSVARWSIFLAALEAAGLVAAVLNAVGMLGLDLPGIVAAVAAGGLAWVQTRQHQQLATAYGIAAQELAEIASRLEWPATDSEWAHFVDEVEEAISREHTLWWASHV
ncbi:DUF4231 domain-containing protein [Actinomadura livida]|uniref:DUF4231 domain-containing protein n=1 Tax=Actinomadura livida TaxID=79909 RepID=A0A7W7IHN3_9ACTN|nr:hypothetical protein [Actinomadura catellatispora]GGU21093.1 membrane protein [Actinomadura livida]